jgi:hypothetical protein
MSIKELAECFGLESPGYWSMNAWLRERTEWQNIYSAPVPSVTDIWES